MSNASDQRDRRSVLEQALLAVEEMQSKLEAAAREKREPVAIVGMGCRFPGGASSPESFWKLLRDGVDAIREVPADRWDVDAYYDPNPDAPGKISSRMGGFLDEVDKFDAYFFGISPREAVKMDPQQRLLLEVSWEALENAGLVPGNLKGSQTGVFIGVTTNDYGRILEDKGQASLDAYHLTGNCLNFTAGRIAYTLGLQGPTMAVDAACSSSAVSVHLACQSLRNRECDVALAGGVNLILSPELSISSSKARMLAPDGKCKTFDASADGYVRGEGCGVVVLKRLSDAAANGDNVLAVIRGSAVNQDGASSGITVPNKLAQIEVIRQALERAGVQPHQVGYVEAHGTGTPLGDPIEVRALATAYGKGRSSDLPLMVGSVKTNVGHLESAAGIGGLIKAVLVLQNGVIPPHLHFKELNPAITLDGFPLLIPTEPLAWPRREDPRLIGVSSFGASGTIVHLVVEEAPLKGQHLAAVETSLPNALLLSGQTREALETSARSYETWLSGAGSAERLYDVCYAAAIRRTHHDHRLALVARTKEEAIDQLRAFLSGENLRGVSQGQKDPARGGKKVFVFPGQGSQWYGMGRILIEREPVFREALRRCEDALRKYVDWSLLEQLTTDGSASRMDQIDVIQPVLFSIQVSLAALWSSWGITPDAVVGHSMGEVAASHIAGSLSLDDAARIICRRSQLLRRASGKGAMALVDLSIEQAEDAIRGLDDRLSVAVSNSVRSTVLSGDPAALDEVVKKLETQQVFCRFIKVDVASHSPQMDALRPDLLTAMAGLAPQRSSIPIYSTVTGKIADGSDLDAAYWVDNLRKPVLFSTAVQALQAAGHDTFVEVSAHPILLQAIQQGFQHSGHDVVAVPSLRRDEDDQAVLLESLGTLHTLGHAVDWKSVFPSVGRHVLLPTYDWQRERFWCDDQAPGNGDVMKSVRQSRTHGSGHPLLGQHMASSIEAATHFWELDLDASNVPYLGDRQVQQRAVVPAGALVEMVLAAMSQLDGILEYQLENVQFSDELVLPAEGAVKIQLIVTQAAPGGFSFQISSQPSMCRVRYASWTLHATGSVCPISFSASETVSEKRPVAKSGFGEFISGAQHYDSLESRSLRYGPAFQGVEELWWNDLNKELIARVVTPKVLKEESNGYRVHPVLFENCVQVMLAAISRSAPGVIETDTLIPVELDRVQVHIQLPPDATAWVCAIPRHNGAPSGECGGDVFVLNEEGVIAIEINGLRLQTPNRTATEDVHELLYRVAWRPQALSRLEKPAQSREASAAGTWVLFADDGGVARSLAAQLRSSGETCVLVIPGETYGKLDDDRYELHPGRVEDFKKLFVEVSTRPCRGVVYLWPLNSKSAEETTVASLEAANEIGCGGVLHVVQSLAQVEWNDAPRLWLVTRGAQHVSSDDKTLSVTQSPIWGLGRVIANEHPEFHPVRIDLGSTVKEEEVCSLVDELLADSNEDEVAYRRDARYVARLERWSIAGETRRVEVPAVPSSRRLAPRPGEVEIQVCAVGLNFTNALGPLGNECSGVIVAIGEQVERFRVGDEVIALGADCLGTHVLADSRLVAHKPSNLDFCEAASVGMSFLTAHFSLHELAHVRRGERVLIHEATSAIGLAAIQLAQRAGAEIFATAGSVEQQDHLKSLGVHNVMDSRSVSFADEIMNLTGREGVDIILNSLSGEARACSLAVLRPFGRFIELGECLESDQIGLVPFRKSLAYFAVDMHRMVLERPSVVADTFQKVVWLLKEGSLKPLPQRVFPAMETTEALRHIAEAKHVGTIAVSFESDKKTTERKWSEGTYLITGGFGGLGLEIAKWLVGEGVRSLVLVGRRGASPSARITIDELKQRGADVLEAALDVAQTQAVERLFRDIEHSLPPLRGVFHAAGILDDGVLLQLDPKRFHSVMAPKVSGAWNLHAMTLTNPVDFFVLFSGAASLLGSPGQGNYAAANAFLDGLAEYRRSLGMPSLSINWGPWSEVGLAAAQANRGDRLAVRGLTSIAPKTAIKALALLLSQSERQVAVMPFNLRQWEHFYPKGASSPFFSDLRVTANNPVSAPVVKPPASMIKESLFALEPGRRRRSAFETYLQEQVASVLKISSSLIELNKPLKSFGLDSLLALELRNRFETGLELTLPGTLIWNYPTVAMLADHLAQRMGLELEEPRTLDEAAPSVDDADEIEKILAELGRLPEKEARQKLSEMVN